MSNRQSFFCFGPPKSGTTLLQRCLDLHPKISCPSEHHLDFLLSEFTRVFSQYNDGLALTDFRTGGQGCTSVQSQTIEEIFKFCVEKILQQCGSEIPCVGLKDNSISDNLGRYHELFPEYKFIAIFRHPVPLAVSAWHYNLRLAEDEREPSHANLVLQFGSYDEWVLFLSEQFNQRVERFQRVFGNATNAFVVRYEDLVESKHECLKGLFNFLGVETTDSTLREIVEATKFQNMRAAARRPHFFRAAATSPVDQSVSLQLQRKVEEISCNSLRYLGYPIH